MVEALAERHMGRVVRAFRCHPWHGRTPVPQEVVGDWLQLKQSQVSKLECGRPRKHLSWLTFVARTLRIPVELLWFKIDGEEHGDTSAASVMPTVAPRVPNELLRRARLARVSPSGSGRVLSRQELAEAVNAWVFANHQRRISLDYSAIGKFERGDTRWPAAWVRAGFRAVLGVETDAEIGLYIVYNFALPAAAADRTAPDVLPTTSEPAAPPTGPVSWDAVAEARRELGGLLAGWRERAGLTQLALGERVRWARSTVANVERGQEVRRSFWEGCDQATGAQGALLAAADHVSGLAGRCRAQETDEGIRQHAAALAPHAGTPDGVSAGAVDSCTADAVGDGPTVHVTVTAGASVTLAFGGGGTVGGQPFRVVVTAADEQPRDLETPAADGARVYSLAAWRGRH